MISRKCHSSSILLQLVSQAVESGADQIEVEYKDGYEEVYAFTEEMGYGIATLKSSSDEAARLRQELYKFGNKKTRINLSGIEYELKVSVFESFGEDAFRVKIRTI